MKKFIILLSLFLGFLGLVMSTPNAHAITLYPDQEIYVERGPGTTGGGVFEIYEWNGGKDGGAYIHDSFCIERNEEIKPGFWSKYIVSNISDGAVQGGFGGGNPDLLDPMTAYLFYNFYYGTLPIYNGSDGEADKLQAAIWYIEEEYAFNDYTQLAYDANWLDIGLVRVVNLADDAGAFRQDLLTVVPEPATMLLLGSGLIGLAFLGRKKLFKK
jgi:hypothetical protein